MLKRDLEAVGIPYVDDSGLYADFHIRSKLPLAADILLTAVSGGFD